MIAIPTTCGTGSECTVASVVTDLATNEKYAINNKVKEDPIDIVDEVKSSSNTLSETFCPRCGKKFADEDRFCSICGRKRL